MSKNSNSFSQKLKHFLIVFFSILILLNLGIIVSGKTYLYKGIQATYLQGKMGPGIYDSITFPVRIAPASTSAKQWEMDSTQINLSDSALHQLEETETTSFLIVKNDKIIHESYYGDHHYYTKSNSFSMAKSLIGLMIGLAVDKQEIKSFDEPIVNYLPFRITNDDSVTIRDLLGMSSGLAWSESGINPFSDNAEAYYTSDLRTVVENLKFVEKPGEIFEYKSGNSQILGVILEEATGMHPTDYFEKHVWSKINSENDLLWSLDHENGIEKTFCCAYATTRDYARIGQLILDQGQWNDNQIIDRKILKEITSPYNEQTQHYGLHFWIYNHPEHPAVYLRGILGQYIIVVPSLNVVMVRTGHKRKGRYSSTDGKVEDVQNRGEYDYKLNHPLDLFDYFSILKEVLNKE